MGNSNIYTDKIIYSDTNFSQSLKDIELELENKEFHPNVEFKGIVRVNFPGRYDGIVINTQIFDSNELMIFKSYNEKKISQNVARLFVNRDDMPENRVEFTAMLGFKPEKGKEHEIKFRASIIEQHKEIESVIVFGKILSS